MASRKVSDTVNIDELAKLFDLPDSERVLENFDSGGGETYGYARREALSDGATEEEAEEKAMAAEQEERDEYFGKWHDAVESVATQLFEEHGLTLVPKSKGRNPFEYKVAPEKSWKEAATKIMQTINGVGMFSFTNLKEFLESGPYTERTAVLTHLHQIANYPDVYGGSSASRMYDAAVR